MKKAQSGKLPPEFLSLLSLGKVQKSLVPKSKRKLVGRTVAMRVNTARRMMKANGEVIPSYLTKSETRRLLLIYYWDHQSSFNGEHFYSTTPWRLLRALILEVFGEKCMKCGSVDHIAVDHIKSRLYHPALELDPTNMQVLCRSCNSSKGARVTIDFRPQDWKLMLDSNQSISHLIADPDPVGVRPASPKPELPQYLSITEDCEITLHGRNEHNTVLETLTSQLNRISAQLSSLQADGLIW
jgi:5-methylcytosine-specific restriction endonuclease McrA